MGEVGVGSDPRQRGWLKASVTLLLFSVPALAFACGGKTSGSGSDGGGASSSSSGGQSASSSGSSSGAEALDATPVTDSPAPIMCKVTEMGTSGGGASSSCEAIESETCSDGTTYTVDCHCPENTCTCTATGGNGGSGGTVTYSGCGGCPFGTYLFPRCGFPM